MNRPRTLDDGRDRVRWSLPAGLLVVLAGAFPLRTSGGQETADDCLECHVELEDVRTFADGVGRSLLVDRARYGSSAHGALACVACHRRVDEAGAFAHLMEEPGDARPYRLEIERACVDCHGEHAADPRRSTLRIDRTLHGGGDDRSPTCSDCHAPHAMTSGEASRVPTSRQCATCHEPLSRAFARSAHGAALAGEDHADVPVCVDCHGGHVEQGKGAVARKVRLGQPCMGCHADEAMMARHGISTNVVSTYLRDFHGVSTRFYGQQGDITQETLVCSDCHGIHDVARVEPGSEILMKEHLVEVCRRCHVDAAASFPDAWLSHYEPSLAKAPLVYLVKVAYWIFIPFVITGLLLQIAMHLVIFPWRQRRLRRRLGPDAPLPPTSHVPLTAVGPDRIVRFSRRARLEHFVVMVTFLVLLLTGLPQSFSDTGWAAFLVSLFGGVDTMRITHRVAGIAFAVVAILHLALAILAVLRGRGSLSMALGRQDFRDAIQNLRWYLGRADAPPRFDRYDYRQKFEYWGLILGGTIMIGTGFVLYFPMFFSSFLPAELIPAAKTAHSYEALMAMLTILVWHLYGAHLNPDCFPADLSIFTGVISRERMIHEHPLEYEREVLGTAILRKDDPRPRDGVGVPEAERAEEEALTGSA